MRQVQTATHTVVHDTTRHRQKFAAKHLHYTTSVHRRNGKMLYIMYPAVVGELHCHCFMSLCNDTYTCCYNLQLYTALNTMPRGVVLS